MFIDFNTHITTKQNKIVAVGKNYIKHVQEMGGEQPPAKPVIFTKPWGALTKTFILPAHGREIHHETELGVVISKEATKIEEKDAFQYVGGYFLGLDMTDRQLQAEFKKDGFPWDLAKGQDGFLPISEYVPKEIVKDPHNLELLLTINGNIVQQDSTQNMYFKIPTLISFISQYMTLYPGDLILTGTPSGVGPVKFEDKLHAQLIQNNETIAEIKFKVDR